MPVGRKRSETSRRAILDSSLALLRARGYRQLTMDAIAADAGVGKQTIYRWWKSKAAVVLEALAEDARTIAVPDTGGLESDLVAFFTETFRLATGPRGTQGILKALMAEAQLDPTFATPFTAFIAGRRDVLRAVLLRYNPGPGRDNADTAVDMLFGAMWYRLLVGHAALDAAFARSLARTLANGYSRKPADARMRSHKDA